MQKFFLVWENLQWKIKENICYRMHLLLFTDGEINCHLCSFPVFLFIVLIRCSFDTGIGTSQKVIPFNWRHQFPWSFYDFDMWLEFFIFVRG